MGEGGVVVTDVKATIDAATQVLGKVAVDVAANGVLSSSSVDFHAWACGALSPGDYLHHQY